MRPDHEIAVTNAEFSRSKLYGKGVFTTIAVVGRKPVFWEKHWRRLTAQADLLGIDLAAFDEERVLKAVADALPDNAADRCRARVTFTDESPSEIWSEPGPGTTHLSVIAAARRSPPASFSLAVSPHLINTTSPLAGVKSCNYLEPLMALSEANGRGFDEAIRINERGEISSACLANVFWLKSGRLFTPSLTTGCLAGTTREFILENLDCAEVEAPIEELQTAEAIFLSSAGLGIVQAARFGEAALSPVKYPILTLLPF